MRIFICPSCNVTYDLNHIERHKLMYIIDTNTNNKLMYCLDCLIKLLMNSCSSLQYNEEKQKEIVLNENRELIMDTLNSEIDYINKHKSKSKHITFDARASSYGVAIGHNSKYIIPTSCEFGNFKICFNS